ncbi:MAG: SUMF1/EgtB/PvdO family nonheme iron enzyme [Rhodothermales bacterium]|nr:SUMF1/EgtB/PvdO family nonheme iron enzyme [Rhodothermales bacterium]
MRNIRVAALLIAMMMTGAISTQGQSIFLNGGSVFNDVGDLAVSRANYTALQVGARTWMTNRFQVQGAITLLTEPSAEIGLQFRPLGSDKKFSPYLYTGFAYLFATEDYRSAVPIGVGGEFRIDQKWGVQAGVARVSSLAKDNAGYAQTITGYSPSMGITYRVGKKDFRPERDRVRNPLESSAVAENSDKNSRKERKQAEAAKREDPKPRVSSRVSTGVAENGALIGEEMTLIPDGMFIMGLADEDPLSLQTAGFKRITVSSVLIDRFEVSNAEYREWLGNLPAGERESMLPDTTIWDDAGFRFSWNSYFRGPRYQNHPVVGLTFDQAKAYCDAQNKRLPTEAEWEYASRSGREGGIYPWDGYEARNLDGEYMANYNNGRAGYAADGYAFTSPVNAYYPNEWGLYNMSGNVAEWVEDAYSATYLILSDFNPYHIDEAETRHVVRGGSWASDEFYIGVGVRDAQEKDQPSPYVGCRCALDISEDDEMEMRRANGEVVESNASEAAAEESSSESTEEQDQ